MISGMRNKLLRTAAVLVMAAVVFSCGPQRKLHTLRENGTAAQIAIPEASSVPEFEIGRAHRDTIIVQDPEGNDVLIMKAIRDDDGEMVAHDVLDAAVVTARFRNVAERHGKVDIEFQVTVPEAMQDSRWQLRLYPDMFILDDSVRLDPVIITGRDYRKAQLKGYQQYERFLAGIVSDTTRFINVWQLELFLERNIPEVYAFKSDSTYVSDEQFESVYGVTQRQAVTHYTNQIAYRHNERRKGMTDRMYRRYVKVPIVTEGLRLDTVIQAVNGDFIYNYVQTVSTRPKLRKVDIVLSGDIWESSDRIYDIPRSDSLTFYISSLSAFVDGTQRYLTRVIERRAEANTACYVEFAQGSDAVDLTLGENRVEIGRIKGNLNELIENEVYDLDSIVVTAECSPEGSYALNTALSKRRSESVSRYFQNHIRSYIDSLNREEMYYFDFVSGAQVETGRLEAIKFISRNHPENWDMLDNLVQKDTLLDEGDRARYHAIRALATDPDEMELQLSREPRYQHFREVLYPRLRTVRFDFHLHRKGMVKDTVHTTEPDTVYMEGVQAIRDREYERAVTLLRPYNDFNTAIAYCSMDYNASAMAILRNLEKTPQVSYMLAVLHSRDGDDEEAVRCFIEACRGDGTFVHRGNLDPEISSLIRRYSLEDILFGEEPEYDL